MAKTQPVQLVTEPTTKPPDARKPYIPVLVDGKEQWFLLSEDAEDVTAGDFDFAKGAAWAKQQQRAAGNP